MIMEKLTPREEFNNKLKTDDQYVDDYERFLNAIIKIDPLSAKETVLAQLLNSQESRKEFNTKIKTDVEFAKKWTLKKK